MLLQNIKTYLKRCKTFKQKYPQSFSIWKSINFFPVWLGCLQPNKTPLDDERPWITFAAIEFLENTLTKEMKVFEYGVGGSTAFFIKRVKEVISVEHDPKWLEKVSEKIIETGRKNWKFYLEPPIEDELAMQKLPSDPYGYVSSDENFRGKSFKNYVRSIDQYPDEYFDIVLVDGRARPSCSMHALPKIKQNGFIVLDNSDREDYSCIHETLNSELWIKYDFVGAGGYVSHFWQTCIWKKVE
ncbi:O-methyltransferase [Pseudanabaena mucicola]|uniref:Class I SAM-dependent methyltransferase n=1 Tax=Pseudanabaena mucicola FACHB-723 TaxID=2692860 RepID=A0ABR7ZV22_9CYAN|nr:hypothetical protein [Pseudanabaena mucicola]MBD2187111.1 hypothetical protein [Pseudanabaena mucicola FACHB-723]